MCTVVPVVYMIGLNCLCEYCCPEHWSYKIPISSLMCKLKYHLLVSFSEYLFKYL